MAGWAVIPTIRVPDMDEAMSFYRDKLGFTLDRDEYSQVNNSIVRGDARIQLETPGDHFGAGYNEAIRERMEGRSATTLYMEADDIDELYARVGELGIRVVDPLAPRPWKLREFTIEDHLGHWLTFWNRDSST